jgi:hypothetical protein
VKLDRHWRHSTEAPHEEGLKIEDFGRKITEKNVHKTGRHKIIKNHKKS